MEHLFQATLITIGLTTTGFEEVKRDEFPTVAECHAARHQREFTERDTSGRYVGLVFLCEFK